MRIALTSLVLLCVLALSTPAKAGFGIGASVGEGVLLDAGSRTAVNVEVLPSYSFGIVSADIGFVFHMEDEVDLLIRPGARLNFWLLYARVALPFRASGDFDWGFMVGLGANLLNGGVVKLFIEADASFYEQTDFEVVPLEARLGIEIGF